MSHYLSESEPFVSITNQTLLQLRRIRTAVIRQNPDFFGGQPLSIATALVYGLTGLAMTYLESADSAGFYPKLKRQQVLIQKSKTEYPDVPPTVVSGSNYGRNLSEWMETLAQCKKPWSVLSDRNDLGKSIHPKGGQAILSPLSSGPLLINLVQRLTNSKSKLVLGVVDTTSTEDFNRNHRMPKVYLPRSEALKPGNTVHILDDVNISGLTRLALQTELTKSK